MLDKTEIDTKVNIVHEIGLKGDDTFYTRNGDFFSRICLYCGLIMFGFSFFMRIKKFNPRD